MRIFLTKHTRELKIWQKGFSIAERSFKLVNTFPKEESFELSVQIMKAAVSIPSNIAEGSSRTSEKDYNRFHEISLGSCFELETQLLLAGATKFGDDNIRLGILKDIDEEQGC